MLEHPCHPEALREAVALVTTPPPGLSLWQSYFLSPSHPCGDLRTVIKTLGDTQDPITCHSASSIVAALTERRKLKRSGQNESSANQLAESSPLGEREGKGEWGVRLVRAEMRMRGGGMQPGQPGAPPPRKSTAAGLGAP